jgi:hypothetical protein
MAMQRKPTRQKQKPEFATPTNLLSVGDIHEISAEENRFEIQIAPQRQQ